MDFAQAMFSSGVLGEGGGLLDDDPVHVVKELDLGSLDVGARSRELISLELDLGS